MGQRQTWNRQIAMSAITRIVLQNSKMTCQQKFAARPSDRVFSDQMPCNELTKVAGWKSDQSCDPSHDFRVSAPAPLETFVRTPKKSFATQSLDKRTLSGEFCSSALGHFRLYAPQQNPDLFNHLVGALDLLRSP
jgi:hypothetical protein